MRFTISNSTLSEIMNSLTEENTEDMDFDYSTSANETPDPIETVYHRQVDLLLEAKEQGKIDLDGIKKLSPKIRKGNYRGLSDSEFLEEIGLDKQGLSLSENKKATRLILNGGAYRTNKIDLQRPLDTLEYDFSLFRVRCGEDFPLQQQAKLRYQDARTTPSIAQLVNQLNRRNKMPFHKVLQDERMLRFGLAENDEKYLIVKDESKISLYSGINGVAENRVTRIDEFESGVGNFVALLNNIVNTKQKNMSTGPIYTLPLEQYWRR